MPGSGSSGGGGIAAGVSLGPGGSVAAPAAPSNASTANLELGPQAPLVSSAPARSATAANITKLQTVTTPPATNTGVQNGPTVPATTPSLPSGITPVTATTNTPAKGGTNTGTTPTTFTSPQSASKVTLPSGAIAYYTPANGSTPESMTDSSGNALTYSQAVSGWIDPTTGSAPVNTSPTSLLAGNNASNAGQPGYDQYGNPTSSTSSSDPYAAAVAGITDPGIAAQMKNALQTQDSEATALQTTITSLQNATAATDPATMAAVAAIQAKYGILIQQMQAKNAQIVGRASSQAAAFGGLGTQGNALDGTFMSNETSDAQQRVASLQDEEQSLILQAQAAFSANNTKALNDAMAQYDTINQQKITALNDLLTAMSKQTTSNQAQQKIDLTTTNDQTNNDVKNSVAYAPSIANNIIAAGITDPNSIAQYVQNLINDPTNHYNISDANILLGEVQKQIAAQQKATLAASNVTDTIANRDARTGATLTRDQTLNVQGAQRSAIAYQTYQAKVAAGTLGGTAPVYKFTPTITTSLYGAGATDAQIKQLSSDIAQYGPQQVLDHAALTPAVSQILQTTFGITPSSQ